MRHALLSALILLAPGLASPVWAQITVRATPSLLDFGAVQIGESATLQISVRISGSIEEGPSSVDADLSVSNPAFTLSRTEMTLTSSSRTVDVTFTPTAPTDYTGEVLIETVYDEDTVDLFGLGESGFTVEPSTLDFGATPVGCATSELLTVDAPQAYDFTVLTSDAQFTVSPDRFNGMGTFLVTVMARPTEVGLLRGMVDVTGSASEVLPMTRSADLRVRGSDVVPSPSLLDFGSVGVGMESAPETITLRLDTGLPTGLMVEATSDNPAFVVQPMTATDRVEVVFAPQADGAQSGMITLSLTSPSDPMCQLERMVPVSGIGQPGDVTVDPASLDFGTVLVGETSDSLSVTLSSQATAAFNGVVAMSNPDFQVSPAEFGLPAGGTRTVDFTFAPGSAGARTGMAEIELRTTAGSIVSLTVALSGNASSFTVQPENFDFGTVGLGVSSTAQFTLSNAVGSPLSVDVTAGAPFTAPAQVTVPANGSTTVDVTFLPEQAGLVQGQVTFTARPAEGVIQRQRVSVRGEGVEIVLRYEITAGDTTEPLDSGQTVDFGPAAVGMTSTVNVSVFNDGVVPYTLEGLDASGPGFTLVATPGVPPDVPPGGQYGVPVEFTPAALGSASGTLSIDGVTFPLAGRGILSGASVSGIDPAVDARATAEVGVEVDAALEQPVNGTLLLEFVPEEGLPDDPAVQFSTGGRSAGFTVRPGATAGQFADDSTTIAIQTGTVAGEIRVIAQFDSDGEDVGPAEDVVLSGIVAAAAPVITNVAITEASANAFTVQVTGYATPRSIDAADFSFTGRDGIQLQPGAIGLEGAGALFGTWFGSEESFPFGSAFTLTVPFTIGGEPNAVASVSVTLTNELGTSEAVSASVP